MFLLKVVYADAFQVSHSASRLSDVLLSERIYDTIALLVSERRA